MITVTFFSGETWKEKDYSGECAAVIANIDMIDHIQAGGWCMVGYKNRYVVVTNPKQLGIDASP